MSKTAAAFFFGTGALVYGLLAWRAAVGWDRSLLWRSLLAGGVGAPLLVQGAAAAWGFSRLPCPAFVAPWLAVASPPWLGAVEEVGKALVLGAVFWRQQRRLADAFDGALSGLFAGAGYGLWALWTLVRNAPATLGDAGVLLHLLAGWTLHGVTGAGSGALLAGIRQLWLNKRALLCVGAVLALSAPAAAQASYLALAAAVRQAGAGSPATAAGLLLLEWSGVAVLVALHGWRRRRGRALWSLLREEVATGLLSEEEFYTLAIDGRGVSSALRQALLGLAAAKWRLSRGLASPAEVERWRRRVSAARGR